MPAFERVEAPTERPDPTRHRADRALTAAVLRGDAAALDELVARMECVPRFLAALNVRLGRPLGPHDLADLAQDTLIVIWEKLETFEGRATLESWTYRFCYLELMNFVRRKGRRARVAAAPLEVQDRADPGIEPGHSPSDFEHVERCLADLPPDEEEVIRLKHFEGLVFVEIAARLGTSPNTVKTRYYRGMGRLRATLARHERQDPL